MFFEFIETLNVKNHLHNIFIWAIGSFIQLGALLLVYFLFMCSHWKNRERIGLFDILPKLKWLFFFFFWFRFQEILIRDMKYYEYIILRFSVQYMLECYQKTIVGWEKMFSLSFYRIFQIFNKQFFKISVADFLKFWFWF